MYLRKKTDFVLSVSPKWKFDSIQIENFKKIGLRALALRNVLNSSWNEFTFSYNLSFSNRKVWRNHVLLSFYCRHFLYASYNNVFCKKKDLDVIGLFEMKWLTHFDANIICKMTIQPVCHSNTSHALTKFFLTSHLNYLNYFKKYFRKYSSY